MPTARRTFLAGTAAAAGVAALPIGIEVAAAADAHAGPAERPDVHVVVVDGLRRDEVTSELMPRLTEFADAGTRFTDASAVAVAETLPNHAAMMTGVLPYRNGVPANSVRDPETGAIRDLDRPGDLWGPSLLDRIRTELGLTTASVLSKRYLHGLFGDRASVVWDPAPLVPITGHAPDEATVQALLDILARDAPAFTFTNLGDVDRVGHLDLTGVSARVVRTGTVRNTDRLVGRVLDRIRTSGRWDTSVVVVLADHSMDWSSVDGVVSLTPVLEADDTLRGRVSIAQNGGAALVYFTGPEPDRPASVERMRTLVAGTPGVDSVVPTDELSLGPRAGDLAAFCVPGRRFSDPWILSNPIPGNHGHAATTPIPFVVGGGHPVVRAGVTDPRPVRTLDVAPTVAALFGLAPPPGGWDGTAVVSTGGAR